MEECEHSAGLISGTTDILNRLRLPQTLRERLCSKSCMSRIALALGLAEHVRLGKGARISQAILEDVLEAMVGAIDRELGFVELCLFTEKTFGPMAQAYKDILVGKSQWPVDASSVVI